MKALAALGVAIVWIVLIVGGLAGLTFGGYYATAYFAPRYEAVRRDTMIQSRAYNEASTRELYRIKVQYLAAQTAEERATLKAFALHEATAFDRDRLPLDLRAFLAQLGG